MSIEIKKRQSFEWIKDSHGDTWICPRGAVKDRHHPTNQELKACVQESYNPGEGG